MRHFFVSSVLLLAFVANATSGEKPKVDPFEASGRNVVESSVFQYFQFGVVPPLRAWPRIEERDYTTFYDQLPRVLQAQKGKQYAVALKMLRYYTAVVRTCAVNRQVKNPSVSIYRALSPHGSLVFVALRRSLDVPSLQQRCWAAATILTFDEKNMRANKVLAEAMKTDNAKLQIEICEMIGRASLANKLSIETLITALNQKNPDVRYAAANAIWNIGRPAKRAVTALIDLLQSPEELDSPNPYYRIAHLFQYGNVTLEALTKMGPDAEPAVPVLMQMLAKAKQDDQPKLNAKPAVPVLMQMFDNPKHDDQRKLIAALAAIGQGAKSCIPGLRKIMNQKKHKVFAAAAILCIDPQDKSAFEFLEKELESKDKTKCKKALEAIGKIGVKTKSLLPFLISRLDGDNEGLIYYASIALAHYGEEAAIAIPRLEKILANENDGGDNSSTYPGAAFVLAGIGKKSVPALIRIIDKRSKGGRLMAMVALGEIGKDAHPALTQLIRIAGDRSDDYRYEACKVIGRLGPHAQPAKPALLNLKHQLLAEEETEEQYFSLLSLEYALSEIGPLN